MSKPTMTLEQAMAIIKPLLEFRGRKLPEYRIAYGVIEAHLAERDAQPKISRRTGWMLESTEGKGWWDGRARWDFTTDPNAAVVFPTRSAADFQRLASFRGDVTVTEHVWMGTQTAQPAAEQAVDVEAMARDAERWRHCVSIKRFPAVCQDGENWVAWKTASPISSTHGNSPNSAIDAAMGTDTQNT